MSEPLAASLQWLNDSRDAMIETLIQFANINSGSDNLSGLNAMADELERHFSSLQTPLVKYDLADRQWINDAGESCQAATAPALIWKKASSAQDRVLLAIHYDTVYPPESSFQSCRWLDSNRLNGPGVADAKGGIVVLLFALRAIETFFEDPHFTWTAVLNPDEEIGSPASTKLWREIAGQHAFGLLFEPSLPDGSLVGDRKGSGNFTAVVRGRAAHAGRHFEEGRNAVVHAARLSQELDGLSSQRPGLTINVAKIAGGGPLNIVPDLAIVRFNIRVGTIEDQFWVTQQLDKILATYNSAEGFQCELHGGITSPPKLANECHMLLRSKVDNARQSLGLPEARWIHTGGVCDGNKLNDAGLPNIDTLGPRGDRLHSHEEWVDTSSLVPAAQTIVKILTSDGRDI